MTEEGQTHINRDEGKKTLSKGDVETIFCYGSKVKGDFLVIIFLSE